MGGDEVCHMPLQRREDEVQEEALPGAVLPAAGAGAGAVLRQVRRQQGGGGEGAEEPPHQQQRTEEEEIKEVAKSQEAGKNFRINNERESKISKAVHERGTQ